MLYREIIAVCSQIHTKHTNTLCGQNGELWNVKPGGTDNDYLICVVLLELYQFIQPYSHPFIHFLRSFKLSARLCCASVFITPYSFF